MVIFKQCSICKRNFSEYSTLEFKDGQLICKCCLCYGVDKIKDLFDKKESDPTSTAFIEIPCKRESCEHNLYQYRKDEFIYIDKDALFVDAIVVDMRKPVPTTKDTKTEKEYNPDFCFKCDKYLKETTYYSLNLRASSVTPTPKDNEFDVVKDLTHKVNYCKCCYEKLKRVLL